MNMKTNQKKNNKQGDAKFNNSIDFKITKVPSIKYFVGRYSLNQLELLTLQLEVAQGNKPAGIMVKDEKGQMVTIEEDGRLSGPLYGLDMISNLNLKIVQANRIKSISGWKL